MAKRIVFLVTVFVLVFSLTMSIGCTLAWIHTSTAPVVNTFEYGDVNITLVETDTTLTDGKYTRTFRMIPGNTLDKDPTVTVQADSEDCWLFVKITESANLDTFIAYAIDSGWKVLSTGATETVLYRQVLKTDGVKSFGILVAGTHTVNSVDYSWTDNQVLVKPEVTKAQLNALGSDYPTLTFTAYAVQSANLTDSNSNGTTADEAWAIANP